MRAILVVLGFFILAYFCGNAIARTFPKDFKFGVSTAAFQVEGAWNVSGKSESTWDHFVHTYPEKIEDGTNADIACDMYHKYENDTKLMKELGVDFHRFSIAWTRILSSPLTGNVNMEGIRHYNKTINTLLKYGIEPVVTMFHWDTPQSLQELGGFTNPLIIHPFVKYAETLFKYFGDRVKKWITFNEPYAFCYGGYGLGVIAPGYSQSGIADYLCSYYTLKAHAAVYHLYNDTYKETQKGGVSIALSCEWFEPASNSTEDINAAIRGMEFELGYFANPIYSKTGDYPKIVKQRIEERSKAEGYLRTRLPLFTKQEIEYIRGTYDFFGFNHYSSWMAADKPEDPIGIPSREKDLRVNYYANDTWPVTASSNDWVVPWGLTNILVWIKNKYQDPEIYILENGCADEGGTNDTERILFYRLYLNAALDAINLYNVRLKSFSTWSLLDNFEWIYGHTNRYGFYQVDFTNPDRPRTPKVSSKYYKKVIETKNPNVTNF